MFRAAINSQQVYLLIAYHGRMLDAALDEGVESLDGALLDGRRGGDTVELLQEGRQGAWQRRAERETGVRTNGE
jgi:hypothetical protein